MSLGGLSDILGMGITVQLRNMFTVPASQVVNSSRGLSNAILGDAHRINTGLGTMAAGGSLMFLGTGMMALFYGISKATLKASSDLEIFRNQIRLLAKSDAVGDSLFQRLTQFAIHAPFTIPQVMAGAKNLLAFGFSANRVLGELRLAGEWASMMQMPIDYAAMILGKIRSGGIAQAMRFMQVRGISYADIAAAGGPIDPKTQRTQKGADPEKFLEAVNKVIQNKFGGGMNMYMGTLPGMMTNLKDQLILMAANIGDGIKPKLKDVMKSILSIFNPDLIKPFSEAFGSGLAIVIDMARVAVTPLALFVVWVMRLSKEHPNLVKYGIAAAFVASALITLSGAFIIAAGAYQVLQFALGAPRLAAFRAGLMGLMGPLGWITLGVILFATIWNNNFLGIRTVIQNWWTKVSLIGSGLKELFTNINGGVATISQKMADNLGANGVLGTTITLYMAFYRLYQFLAGFWDGLKVGIEILAFMGSVILWATAPVWGIFWALWKVGLALGWVGNSASSSVWKAFGMTVGVIASAVGIASAVTRVWAIWTAISTAWTNGYNLSLAVLWVRIMALTIAQRAATISQWLLNVALTANPIGLIIVGIAALIGIIVLVVTHFKQITNWFSGLPGWAKVLLVIFLPFIFLPVLIAKHWDVLKKIFHSLVMWIKDLWHDVTEWMAKAMLWVIEKLAKVLKHLPGHVGQMFREIDDSTHRREENERLLSTHPGMTLDQIKGLSSTHFSNAMDRHTTRVSADLHAMTEAMHKMNDRPIQVQQTIKLDHKTIGHAAMTFRDSEAASGR